MKDVLNFSPTELAAKIRNLEVSPVEVVESHIDRIREINPDLNAVVVETFERARDRADEVKNLVTELDDHPPLLGVPCTIKEMISVRNQPITCGSTYRESATSTRDARVVERIREAGAIPLGLTNVPEFGLWIETNNPVYGRTNNPHDPDRTSGGSSGGEAAVVASGGSPFGLGSDMGGSIRIPSTFCGVYGHKSTVNRVDTRGHFPVEHSSASPDSVPDPELVSIGPISRHASDLKLLFDVISEPASGTPTPSNEESRFDPGDLTVHVLEDPDIQLTSSTKPAQRRAVKRTADLLAAEGADVEPLPDDYFRSATKLYTTILESKDLPSTDRIAGAGEPISAVSEIGRKLLSRGRHSLPMLVLSVFDRFYTPSASSISKALEKRDELRRDLGDRLGENGVLVMPAYPNPAPTHGRTLLKPFDLMYSAIFNVLDLPVTSAPIGSNAEGLPTGVQLVVPPGRDELSLSVAEFLEEATGTPPVPEPKQQ